MFGYLNPKFVIPESNVILNLDRFWVAFYIILRVEYYIEINVYTGIFVAGKAHTYYYLLTTLTRWVIEKILGKNFNKKFFLQIDMSNCENESVLPRIFYITVYGYSKADIVIVLSAAYWIS